jgi:hypothetical protein
MRHMFRAAVVAAALVIGFSPAAQADTFVWKDAPHGYTISFPDSWAMQTDDGPYTRIRIAGPLAEEIPTCRLQVREDGRLKIYPKRLTDEAVANTLVQDYWEKETGQYLDAEITAFYSPASLGDKGDATAIQVAFKQLDQQGNAINMHGVMISSLYGGKRYVGSCSSRAENYNRWAGLFLSILDSVQFDDRYHIFPTGYYRNFLMDKKLHLPRVKPGTVSVKNKVFFDKDFIMNR